MRTIVKLLPLLFLPFGVGAALAQGEGGPPDVPIRIFPAQDGVTPGGTMRVAVVYDVPADHHIQINEFLFANPAAGESFRLGSQVLPPLKKWEGEPIMAGKVAVVYDLTLAPETPEGERTLRFVVGYQQCSESPVFACFAPEEREASLSIRVVAEGVPVHPVNATYFPKVPPSEEGGRTSMPAPGANEQGGTGESGAVGEGSEGAPVVPTEGGSAQSSITAPQGDLIPAGEPEAGGASSSGGVHEGLAAKLREALARGSWLAFLLVFVAGFLTSFTPCVYPMIPITIGYVAGASRGRLSGFILSLFFVLGIAIVYSALGVAAALSGGIFGAALQSRTALCAIASVFILMGASMLGAFDLSLPSGLQTKMQSGRRGGWAGAILMGGITGLVASPCVGPVLVVLLTWVAQVGRPLYGFGLLFTFALGLGLLFLVIGSFVGAMKGLPRAGAWMETVKHYFGWIFLGLAAFYLRTVIGPIGTTVLYGALLVILATQIGAFTALSVEAGKGAHWRKGFGIVLAVLGIGLMMSGLLTQQGWRVSRGGVAQTSDSNSRTIGGPLWRTDEQTALAEALAAGRPVLIDFTADWCAACHELDRETWSDPEVTEELSRYTALRIDLTHKTPETDAIRGRWMVAGLPTVIVLNGQGGEVERFFGFRPPAQVLPLLRQVA